MNEDQREHIIEGRKTFFIVPDATLMPETFLEDFMARGYETYIVGDDRYCPLKAKVEVIIETFTDSILFFYIDMPIKGIKWEKYIKELQEKYMGRILIGVLYAKRQSDEEKAWLEKYYLFDVGIQCGCIALEYQKNKNFALIDKVMYANQACGRRKNIRAICDTRSKVSFVTKHGQIKGSILDVSLSHFSCIFEKTLDIQMYEKVPKMLININGLHFVSDAILIMQRKKNGVMLNVFVFSNSMGQQGVESDLQPRLLERIYQMTSDKAKSLMRFKFEEARKDLKKYMSDDDLWEAGFRDFEL
ncbi:hypothetical protein [Treponema ruminis]|uniref:Uncharacterized protein n=1 Tax=Treponema ruminis TaxID=744515 RepID=A0A7W8G6Y0_9SPIR|nr:hypothetical protein [Treponema ruminis]MBB5224864.1 hypothetical protein [Treponema ruminis]